MRVRTQFIITLLIFSIVLVAIAGWITIAERQVTQANEQVIIARDVNKGVNDLNYLANNYMIYREIQQLERWQSRLTSFSADVARLRGGTSEQAALILHIQANTEQYKNVFENVVSSLGSQGGTIDEESLQVSWSRITVQSQELEFNASSLSQLFIEETDKWHRLSYIVVILLIGVLIFFLLINYAIVQRRTLNSIARLQAGTSIIGSGNLDFQIEVSARDEIGDLSRAFNRMITDLKSVTISKTHLESANMELGREIEERKKAEDELEKLNERLNIQNAQLNSMIASMPNALIIYDRHGQIILTNQKSEDFFNFLGIDNGKPIVRKMPEVKVLDCEGRPLNHLNRPARRALRGEKVIDETVCIIKEGKEPRWFSFSAAPVFVNGSLMGAISTFTDITDRKNVESIKDEFIGLVSHELRTPLTIVTGAIHTAMMEGLPPEEQPSLLHEAAKGAESLAAILDNLIELSRYQSNRLLLNFEPMNIKQVITGVVDQMKSISSAHRLIVDVPEQTPVVRGDKMRLELILRNLIDNAIKYSPKGGEVRITASEIDSTLTVCVSDQGKGIPPEAISKLFQPFQRLEHSRTGIRGLGLGLIVCRRLVEAHGGRIWVESDPGKGSTFCFSIPTGEGKPAPGNLSVPD